MTLYADGVAVGTVNASDTTTAVTTDGARALSAGVHSFTARQTAPGQDPSAASAPAAVTIATAPPAAASSPANVTAGGATTYAFTVTYTDATGVDAATLDGNDILVTGPGTFSQPVAFVSATSSGTSRTATYRITPPGGSWDFADNGTYTLTLQPGQVADTAGNAGPAAATKVGSFTVNVPSPFARHYDFGTTSSPIATGYTRVAATAYTATLGYGWRAGTVVTRDRGGTNSLSRDFNMTTSGTFAVDVPGGTYNVTVTMGDNDNPHDNQAVSFEGVQVDTVSTKAAADLHEDVPGDGHGRAAHVPAEGSGRDRPQRHHRRAGRGHGAVDVAGDGGTHHGDTEARRSTRLRRRLLKSVSLNWVEILLLPAGGMETPMFRRV